MLKAASLASEPYRGLILCATCTKAINSSMSIFPLLFSSISLKKRSISCSVTCVCPLRTTSLFRPSRFKYYEASAPSCFSAPNGSSSYCSSNLTCCTNSYLKSSMSSSKSRMSSFCFSKTNEVNSCFEMRPSPSLSKCEITLLAFSNVKFPCASCGRIVSYNSSAVSDSLRSTSIRSNNASISETSFASNL